jgi:hypothetical protein
MSMLVVVPFRGSTAVNHKKINGDLWTLNGGMR